MRKKSLDRRNVLLAVILVLAAFKADAQLGIPPLVSALPEEAPASLFSTSIGDSDVELFVEGFWEASILSSGFLSFGGPAAGTFTTTPFLFIQRPDLYLLLVFRRQWWLEASVADDIERATWAIGYSGQEDDFIQFARLGNTGILMPDYPYMAFGAPTGAFGAVVSGRDESKGTAFDAMLRWDGLSWRSRSFSGLAETVETIVRPRDQLRGRRFVLPDEGLSSIFLYDHTSSGKRLLQADEYTVSLSKGFVELKAEPQGVLSVVYSISGIPQAELGLYQKAGTEVTSAITVEEASKEFEARNLYALSDSSSRRELFVRNLTSGLTDTAFEVREAGPGLIEVARAGFADPRPDSDAYKRPFSATAATLTPDPDDDGQDWIYEDDPADDQAPTYPPAEGYAIVARSIETVDAIVLGKEAVPGTVTVVRDGVQSEAFEFDSDTGSLELYPPPRTGESIIVRYAVSSADRSDGALVFAAGTRFPWLGMDWALALGGRWSLPGVAYASGGELKPAWTGLSIGMERREADFGFGAQGIAKYARASANGLYRLAGMEDAAAYNSPFRPVSGEIADFIIDTVPDDALATAFPEIMDKIHDQNELNQVLSIKPSVSAVTGDIGLLRYIEPAPLASFERFSFFIFVQDVLPSANLELKVLGGEAGTGGVTVDLPLVELDQKGWLQVEVELDPVKPEVRILTPGGQSLILLTPPTVTFNPVSTVGELRMDITGMTAGTVLIDEIVMEEPEDGLSAIMALDFTLGQAGAARPPYLGVELTGVADAEPSLGGSIRAGWFLGPSEWAVSLAPVWSGDYQSAALGYVLAIPDRSAPIRFIDQYSQDFDARSFSRNFAAVLGVDSLRLGLEAGSQEYGSAAAGYRFSQNWVGSAGWGTMADFGLELAMLVPEPMTAENDPAGVWFESWQLVLPVMESAASSRRLAVRASLLESRLVMDYSQDYTAPGTLATNAGARARLPLSINVFGIEPFLERRYRISESGAVSGFSEDFNFAFDRAGNISRPFMAVPVLDLFMDDLRGRFIDSAYGTDSASYATGAGFTVNRPIGYGLPDLFIPNTLEITWTRTFEAKLESQLEFHDFKVKTTTAAVNLFGYGGAKPLVDGLAYDEYSLDLEAVARYHPVDGALLPSIDAKHSVSTETVSGATIGAESRFSWKRTRTGNQTSESLSISLGKRPARTWLGDLVALLFVKRSKPATPGSVGTGETREADGTVAGTPEPEPGDEGDDSVSRWLDSIEIESAVLRDSFDVSMTLSAQELPGTTALKASLAYATRVILPGSLSVGFTSSINPGVDFRLDGWAWGLGYEFTLDGRVSF
ncbi:MAG: hypothetical protein RBT68_06265 [Spirochaetia bacterium]|jgi:hypothetical protein|nr:hypothetical protein [Spirochaetia bacterium]